MPDASQLATYARLLRLTPVDDPALQATAPAQAEVNPAQPRKSRRDGLLSFLLLVVLPLCLAAGYFWLLAADRYESEARFVLRMPGRTLPSAQMSSFLQSAGITRTDDDGYVVNDYLESRDAMYWLERHAGLKAAVAVARRDPIWGFPNAFTSDTEEGLYRHYQRMMSAGFDSSTGVSTLKVQAFTPEDAQRIACLAAGCGGRAGQSIERAGAPGRHRAGRRRKSIACGSGRLRRNPLSPLSVSASGWSIPARRRWRCWKRSQSSPMRRRRSACRSNELETVVAEGPQITALRTRRAALEAQIAAGAPAAGGRRAGDCAAHRRVRAADAGA